jgi:diaminohydroxyphosphoribosylaminopyrimidine deaminase/5-amino-6-(5-phosphoribosylamino)uracil reductase
VGEVNVAALDPNPRVNGKGLAELEAAGIKVFTGEGEQEARELYRAFSKHINTGLPFVTAKFAMSLDGKIATHTGDSRWITGPQARLRVQEMRRTSDAIMVGVNTVLADDPQLTARDAEGNPLARQPLRVVLDHNARTPHDARLLREPGRTLIVVGDPPESRTAPLLAAGAEVLRLPAAGPGMVDLRALLEVLGARGVVDLLAEGGGTVLGSLFDQGLVDRVVAFIAPRIIGGIAAPSPVGGQGNAAMSQVLALSDVKVEQVGEDTLVVGYPSPGR